MNILRLFHTVRYLKPVQIYGRLWFKLYRPRFVSQSILPGRPLQKEWAEPCEKHSTYLGTNTFRFLNQTRYCEFPGDWNNPDWDKLWLYNLHYFDDLQAIDANARRDLHADLIERWNLDNPVGYGNGWEPYPTSLRIVNWIKWSLAGNKPSSGMLNSLATQARYLRKRLEIHLLGNHLFANAKALVFAGLFFHGDEADRWVEKGLKILAREIPEQVLSDGGHFERSPMYHAIILEDLLDLINMMQAYGYPAPGNWLGKVEKMLFWLSGLSHPDGEIALFNDAAFKIAQAPSTIHAYANRLGVCCNQPISQFMHFAETGYTRCERGPAVALLDVAPVGPDYLPGHAHADSLSFELSLFGQRFIVDTGTSCYGLGNERLRQRGTAAHNTVTINGENSSEVWGGFRVARRAKPLDLKIEKSAGKVSVACSHTGYQRLPGKPLHHRQWVLTDTSLQINDVIHGPFKEAVSRFYLQPDVKIVKNKSPDSLFLILNGGEQVEFSTEGAELRVVESTWHPEFGLSLSNQCLEVVFKQNQINATFGW